MNHNDSIEEFSVTELEQRIEFSCCGGGGGGGGGPFIPCEIDASCPERPEN